VTKLKTHEEFIDVVDRFLKNLDKLDKPMDFVTYGIFMGKLNSLKYRVPRQLRLDFINKSVDFLLKNNRDLNNIHLT